MSKPPKPENKNAVKYHVSVRGEIPADIGEKVSKAHAKAAQLTKTIPENKENRREDS